jgi:4-alpha-glucanotransferase
VDQRQLAAGATSREGEHRALLQTVLGVENDLVIIAAQDLLWLGSEARMNRPGTTEPRNWKWKLEQSFTAEQAETLRASTAAAGRTHTSTAQAA